MIFSRSAAPSPPPPAFFQRLSLLTGTAVLEALAKSRVLVFGLGGVGSWCAEALVRSGVGALGIVDSDRVCVTNVNRQAQATSRTIGRPKAEALSERLLEINPRCRVEVFDTVFSKENAGLFDFSTADYVIDAIDSLSFKLDLIETAAAAGRKIFASMGMAQKLDPLQIKTADIWETRGCPLARLVREGLRRRGFAGHFTAVYSEERLPLREGLSVGCGTGRCLCPGGGTEWCASKKVINGSAMPVTAAAGLVLASLVLRDFFTQYGCGGSDG